MRIEFISTGDEVLCGQIDDTNATWLSQFFANQGLAVTRRSTVADDLFELVSVITEAAQRADIVIVNGGLGPTQDDLSAEAFAQALGESLEYKQPWLDAMAEKYTRMNLQMTDNNRKQALLPMSATIIDNPVGTACGFQGQLFKAQVYFTPGVPHEFKTMVQVPLWQDIQQRFEVDNNITCERFFTFGCSESNLADELKALDEIADIHLGFRASLPYLEVKLTGPKGPLLETACEQLVAILQDRLVYRGNTTMAAQLQTEMIAKGLRLALAESCTGGLVANNLIKEPGSSAYVDRALVTYSYQAKQQLLGVDEHLLERQGAVNKTVAAQMAEGVLRQSSADIAISTTGVAGPEEELTPSGESLPPGRVCFGFSVRSPSGAVQTQVLECQFRFRSREQVRKMAAAFALDLLRRHLTELPVSGGQNYILV